MKEEKPEEKKPEEKESEEKQGSDKILLYAIIIIVGLCLIFMSLRYVIPEEEQPLTIADAHRLNIQGKLKPEQGYVYGPHSFINFDGMWYFQVQSKGILVNVPLRFGPRDIEDIPLYGSIDDRFDNATTIYIAFNPLGTDLPYVAVAVGELTQSLNTAFGNEVIAVCSEDCDYEVCSACKGRPVLNCNNTQHAIISLIQSEEPMVNLKGNCIEIQGTGPELVRHVDRLLLEFYGVVKSTPE